VKCIYDLHFHGTCWVCAYFTITHTTLVSIQGHAKDMLMSNDSHLFQRIIKVDALKGFRIIDPNSILEIMKYLTCVHDFKSKAIIMMF
jgi:hypothetical protein